MIPRRFRLVTLFFATATASLCLAIYLRIRPTVLESSLRRDLEIHDSESLRVLEFETTPTEGRWDIRDEALLVISDNNEFRLVQAYREPKSSNPNFSRWRIGMVSIMYVDGHDEWEFFERRFDQFPTKQEISDFKTWISEW